MADLTENDINAALTAQPPAQPVLPASQEKPPLRKHIEQLQQDMYTGEGILPKLLAGAAMVPSAISSIKMRQLPTIQVPLS